MDAVTVGIGQLKNVAGVALLPGGNVLVADESAGLVLFNFEGQVLKTVEFYNEKTNETLGEQARMEERPLSDLPQGTHFGRPNV